MKKISLSLLLVLLVFPTSAFAGAGEWDYVGSSTFHSQSVVISSGGGNFKACNRSNVDAEVKLWESDPGLNPDDSVNGGFMVPGQTLYANDCLIWDVRDAVDGDNKKAELYLTKQGTSTIKVDFYD